MRGRFTGWAAVVVGDVVDAVFALTVGSAICRWFDEGVLVGWDLFCLFLFVV